MSGYLSIPNPTDRPSNSQSQIKNNFDIINTAFGIDHTAMTVLAQQGYHNVIHFTKQAVNPANIVDVGQLFTKDYKPDTNPASTPDTQLFFLTGNGGTSQLTGNNASLRGYQWLGGVLIQWGQVSQAFGSGTTEGTVTFKGAGVIPFPTALFNVVTAPIYNEGSPPSSQASIAINQDPAKTDNTKFKWQFRTGSGDYKGFFWMAIGN